MKLLIDLHINPGASPKQLKTLAEELEMWCDKQLDGDGCCSNAEIVDDETLADLKAGELPKPYVLRMLKCLREAGEGVERHGGLDETLREQLHIDPWRLREAQCNAGPAETSRTVSVVIHEPHEKEPDIVESLRSTITVPIVQRIDSSHYAEEDEYDHGNEDLTEEE